ncbi:MAG: GNAT family N-acetyltransferase, partial [Oscillospiraceae bacterium]|nr:GNAT family N-acetyltransferase [Oscillospiraceae bacterium]
QFDLPQGRLRISMLDEEPTGVIVVDGGILRYFALAPEFRGRALSPQLLGEAIFMARTVGSDTLTVACEPEHPAALRVLEEYGFLGSPRTLELRPKID